MSMPLPQPEESFLKWTVDNRNYSETKCPDLIKNDRSTGGVFTGEWIKITNNSSKI